MEWIHSLKLAPNAVILAMRELQGGGRLQFSKINPEDSEELVF